MNGRRTGVAVGVALAVCVIGEIVAAWLIVHQHISCGSDIDRLIELTCHDVSHPYRGVGVVLAVVFALLAVAVVATWTVRSRRALTD